VTEGKRVLVELTVVGKDQKGVVASFTNAIFKRDGNIETISQNVVRGLFGMHLEASFTRDFDQTSLGKEFQLLGRSFAMDVGVHYQEQKRNLNLAIMVTKEPQCLEAILDAVKEGRLRASVVLIVGSDRTLQGVAEKHEIPFHVANNIDQAKREARILGLLQRYNVDAIALARYMRILSPNFVWRYPNKIINIHPSLLPAFAGASAYEQAYERGAKIIGCTSHFVTMDLDEGPIIWQEALQVEPNEELSSVKKRGQALEAKALVKALELFAERKLEVRWGRVFIK
jgi:formyltetrahydrofolate deformylase